MIGSIYNLVLVDQVILLDWRQCVGVSSVDSHGWAVVLGVVADAEVNLVVL